jgi:hypothetical protein
MLDLDPDPDPFQMTTDPKHWLKGSEFLHDRDWIVNELRFYLELSRFGVHGSGLENVQRLRHRSGDGPLHTDRQDQQSEK